MEEEIVPLIDNQLLLGLCTTTLCTPAKEFIEELNMAVNAYQEELMNQWLNTWKV